MAINLKQAESLLRRRDSFLMLTHGEGFSLNDGRAVTAKAAESLVCDLFGNSILPKRRKGDKLPLVPSEDGLFPGFSQTWRDAP